MGITNDTLRSLSALEKRLIDDFQHGLSLSAEPFRDMARALGVEQDAVLRGLRRLQASRIVSRVGPVFAPNRVGVSTLVAARVPGERLEAVASMISRYPEVNHNYERTHPYNLWFVVTAANQVRLDRILAEMEQRSGVTLLVLPMERNFFIDLGFPIDWGDDDVPA